MEREPRTAQERAVLLLRAMLAVLNLGWLPPTSSGRLLVWAIRITIGLSVWLLIQSAVNETLWNWLQLLIIPAVLAIGGYWFNRQQQERELRVANQQAQDEALQAYLGQMSQLLTNEDPPLHMARPGERLSTVARASTLTVLTRLDGERKGNVVRFLYEAGLITKDLGTEARQVIDLSEAFLDDAYLRGANL
jgi:hypothetical protein